MRPLTDNAAVEDGAAVCTGRRGLSIAADCTESVIIDALNKLD
jgi:hypothetical protein